jgi:hypothetical protein
MYDSKLFSKTRLLSGCFRHFRTCQQYCYLNITFFQNDAASTPILHRNDKIFESIEFFEHAWSMQLRSESESYSMLVQDYWRMYEYCAALQRLLGHDGSTVTGDENNLLLTSFQFRDRKEAYSFVLCLSAHSFPLQGYQPTK